MEPMNLGPAPHGYRAVTYAEDQPEYRPLPAWVSGGTTGRVVTRWKLTWRERLAVLFGADLWLQLLAFGGAIQPQLPTIGRPDRLGD